MAKSIGIDLGTTNSVAAVKRVRMEVLENAEGDLITPSCVVPDPSKDSAFIVGKHALEWRKQDPRNTVTRVKRLMGRNFLDPEIQNMVAKGSLEYQVAKHSKGTENSLAIVLHHREYTPEEISAEILKKIRKDSENSLDDAVEYAVITVPAYFNDKQKHATRAAAALAGLKVRRLLPEPTAAAISFGVDSVKGDEARTVLIFDFGGGTLDMSILTIQKGRFVEKAKGGDMWLGGEDIDQMIMDWALSQVAEEYDIEDMDRFLEAQDPKRRIRFLGELKEKAEAAKVQLTSRQEAYIDIPGLLEDSDGDPVDVDLELTRDQFDTLIGPMVNTAMDRVRKLLSDTHMTNEDIHQVLMVGGSSRIPSVQEALKREFGSDNVLVHERPMLAIAEGAAILSHRLADEYECPKCGHVVGQSANTCDQCGFDLEKWIIDQGVLQVVHSAAHDYFIGLEHNRRYKLVDKNTALPCEQTATFRCVHPDQRLIHAKFFNMVNEVEESVGDLWLGIDTGSPKLPRSQEARHLTVSLKIDENNLLQVTAYVDEQPEIRTEKPLSRGKADEKLFLQLEQLIDDANKKQYNEYVMSDLTARSLSIIRDIHDIVDPETGQVDEDRYALAEMKLDKASRMASEGISSRSTLNYARSALASYGPAISAESRKAIIAGIKRLEQMDAHGNYQQNIEALTELKKLLRDRLGAVNVLMEIQKAADFKKRTSETEADRYYQTIDEVLKAFEANDIDKAMAIIKSVLPQAREVIRQYESRSAVIYKDIVT